MRMKEVKINIIELRKDFLQMQDKKKKYMIPKKHL